MKYKYFVELKSKTEVINFQQRCMHWKVQHAMLKRPGKIFGMFVNKLPKYLPENSVVYELHKTEAVDCIFGDGRKRKK